ncbi:thioesterase II family protein [Streptomyces sp. NBC_01408]|uniref:thioesterase II family protein n=1 Tax=Streptomyces sp. NBC_01408 TaxID=2903855 RepID=UPI002254FF64|nr:alpha/beta fold hydrolase [Streptomyces sp. NBC_01408]MCX4695647.1 alpha/beta fold hydrolase [Streptomyces sp. NBC_01408]
MTTHSAGDPRPFPSSRLWIRTFYPAPQARMRLLCLPHAGGSATAYFALSRELAPEVEVLAVQYPGRQDRRNEPLLDSIEELRDGVAEALTPWLDRPIALFGHSMGAVLAYEVARLLCQDGGTLPAHLFVSGRGNPAQGVNMPLDELDDRAMITALDNLGGTDIGLLADEDVLRMVAPAIRSDYRAVRTYRHTPGPLLPCPVTALVGDADAMAPVEEVDKWRAYTSADFRLKVFQGGHFYLSKQFHKVGELVYDRLSYSLSI